MSNYRENVDDLTRGRDVFVGADNFWYPVEGRTDIVQAPDVYVAVGRPKGHRKSYKQWEEGGVAPQLAFEVLSPSNSRSEMRKKLRFYSRYRVEEYYVYDPDDDELEVYVRRGGGLMTIDEPDGWVSPRLGIRFDLSETPMRIFGPDGARFRTVAEIAESEAAERRRADDASRRADEASRRADDERDRAARLEARLRAAGIDPDAPAP